MDPQFLTLSILILLFSVILHEVAHGFIALRFGDHTAEHAGRLTLNPIPHIDPIGTVLLPLLFFILPILTGVHPGFFIGWAKPVPINPLNFSDIRKGELAVSLAGIGANLLLAIMGAIGYHLSANTPLLHQIFQFTVAINLMLGIFNLIPIFPLDGSKVLMALLPYHLARSYERLAAYGPFILLFLLYFNVINFILVLFLYPLYSLLGIPAF